MTGDRYTCKLTVTLLSLDGVPDVPVHLKLTWRPGDPVAVEAHIHAGGSAAVCWLLPRDLLLAAGEHGSAGGDGDLRVQPGVLPGDIDIALGQLEGARVVLRLRWDQISGFIGRTYDLVPPDCEVATVWRELDLWALELSRGAE